MNKLTTKDKVGIGIYITLLCSSLIGAIAGLIMFIEYNIASGIALFFISVMVAIGLMSFT